VSESCCEAAATLDTVNTAASQATLPFSSNYSLPNVHSHSPELQGHLQVIGNHRMCHLRHGMPPPGHYPTTSSSPRLHRRTLLIRPCPMCAAQGGDTSPTNLFDGRPLVGHWRMRHHEEQVCGDYAQMYHAVWANTG
jgi:hypothetical protein